MARSSFRTSTGQSVTAVTDDDMRAGDRVAVEEVGLAVLQMMENAGWILARHVRDVREESVVAAANGGGGLACARHLANRGLSPRVILDGPAAELRGEAAPSTTSSTRWTSRSPPGSTLPPRSTDGGPSSTP